MQYEVRYVTVNGYYVDKFSSLSKAKDYLAKLKQHGGSGVNAKIVKL